MRVYVLEFKTPVHIGTKGVGVEGTLTDRIPSDVMYSAMVYALSLIYTKNEIEDIVNRFLSDEPPFILSSLLPMVKDEILLYFPLSFQLNYEKKLESIEERERRIRIERKIKKIKYITYDAFKVLNECDEVLVSEPENSKEEPRVELTFYADNKELKIARAYEGNESVLFVTRDEFYDIKLTETEKRVRNVVDRVTRATDIYYLGLMMFMTKRALIVDADDYKIVEDALNVLSDIGIGGERTYGFGRFKWHKASIKIERGSNKEKVVIQGIYSPKKEDFINLKDSYYKVDIKGGLTTLGMVKAPVLALLEGSVLPSRFSSRSLGVSLLDAGTLRVFKPFHLFWGDPNWSLH